MQNAKKTQFNHSIFNIYLSLNAVIIVFLYRIHFYHYSGNQDYKLANTS